MGPYPGDYSKGFWGQCLCFALTVALFLAIPIVLEVLL